MRRIACLLITGFLLLFLSGCRFSSPPDDEICVEWHRNDYNVTDSFTYNNTNYIIQDILTPWSVDHDKMSYMGQLLTSGVLGREAPLEKWGFALFSSYEEAFAYYQNDNDNPVVIANNDFNIWLNENYCLDPAEKQKFKSYSIDLYDGANWMSYDYEYSKGVSFEELIVDDPYVSDSEAFKNDTGIFITFMIDGIECICYKTSVFFHNGFYCLPSKMNVSGWYAHAIVPLSNEWQEILSDFVINNIQRGTDIPSEKMHQLQSGPAWKSISG